MAPTTHLHRRSIDGVIEQGHHVATFICSLRAAEFSHTVPGTSQRVRDLAALPALEVRRLSPWMGSNVDVPQMVYQHALVCEYAHVRLVKLAGGGYPRDTEVEFD